ncbi:hypothetical protein [Streptomyces sp. NPDC087300]|uniref:hypothetical protein n=1 Tax=Streptomyces sp. NPDC087300 TaxID=3365780 RepID=UPI00381BA083
MAKASSAVDVRPRVWYRTIEIGPIVFGSTPEADDIVERHGDGLSLTSSDNDFYPLVRLETWEGPPADPDGQWDYVRVFQGDLEDRLCVVDLNGNEHGRIEVRPGPYRIRVSCQGRDHKSALLALDPFPPVGPHADPLETWLVQLWPDR